MNHMRMLHSQLPTHKTHDAPKVPVWGATLRQSIQPTTTAQAMPMPPERCMHSNRLLDKLTAHKAKHASNGALTARPPLAATPRRLDSIAGPATAREKEPDTENGT